MEAIHKHNVQIGFFYINDTIRQNDFENIWSRLLSSGRLFKVLQCTQFDFCEAPAKGKLHLKFKRAYFLCHILKSRFQTHWLFQNMYGLTDFRLRYINILTSWYQIYIEVLTFWHKFTERPSRVQYPLKFPHKDITATNDFYLVKVPLTLTSRLKKNKNKLYGVKLFFP